MYNMLSKEYQSVTVLVRGPDIRPASLTSRWFCKKARKSAVLMENVASTIWI